MTSISFCTYNVRGLRNHGKRRKIFAFLHNRNYDFIFLQETHSVAEDRFWINEWDGKIFMSHGSNVSRGTAILVKSSLAFDLQNVILDHEGRFVILFLLVFDIKLALVNIYGPNLDNPNIINLILHSINNNTNMWDFIVWGGDFNFVMNLEIDKKGGQRRTNFNVRSATIKCMQSLDLTDIWRDRNPKTNSYTWHSGVDSIHCRLDFFLVSKSLRNLITDCKISPGICSDHSTVILNLHLNKKRGKGIWKLNTSLLNDKSYIKTIKDAIYNIKTKNPNLDHVNLWELCKSNIRTQSIIFSNRKSRNRRNVENDLINKIAILEQSLAISPSEDTASQLAELRKELEDIYNYKLQGIIIRSRAKWVEEGEKNTSYFFEFGKKK